MIQRLPLHGPGWMSRATEPKGDVYTAPVNHLKLMPATYVILFVVVGYMLLTVTADLVNPIRLFQ